jgi:DNA-binding transcriptional LysR family regulator
MLSGRLIDIVSERFDAGVRIGEELAMDMIAIPIGPKLRMAAVASPEYLSSHGTPLTPADLAGHSSIGYRRSETGAIYAWEFAKNEQRLKARPQGQLVFNDAGLLVEAALAGRGIAFVLESSAERYLKDGCLIRILEDWCQPFPGFHLYYPSRRQNSVAFNLLVDRLRYREP